METWEAVGGVVFAAGEYETPPEKLSLLFGDLLYRRIKRLRSQGVTDAGIARTLGLLLPGESFSQAQRRETFVEHREVDHVEEG